MDWFLCDRDLRHERVNALLFVCILRDIYSLIMRHNNWHLCIQISKDARKACKAYIYIYMKLGNKLGKVQNLGKLGKTWAKFGQGSKLRRPRTFWRENLVFHWRKISYFNFTYIYIFIHIYSLSSISYNY